MWSFIKHHFAGEVTITSDGGVRPHPDGGFVSCYGWVIGESGEVMRRTYCFARSDNNPGSSVAELGAVAEAMKEAIDMGLAGRRVRFMCDCRSVISMCIGESVPTAASSVKWMQEIEALKAKFSEVVFEWIPRDRNTAPDALCYKAYRAALNSDGRGKLMAKIRGGAYHHFGKKLSDTVLEGWIESVVGYRTSLLRTSTRDLNVLLAQIQTIGNFRLS